MSESVSEICTSRDAHLKRLHLKIILALLSAHMKRMSYSRGVCGIFQHFIVPFPLKTRRGSPVDDRPATDKLHHFVRKKNKKIKN